MVGKRTVHSVVFSPLAVAQRVLLLDLSDCLADADTCGAVAITAAAYRSTVYASPEPNFHASLSQQEMEDANIEALISAITRIEEPAIHLPALLSIRLSTPYNAASNRALSIARTFSRQALPQYLVMLSKEESFGRQLIAATLSGNE